MFLYFVTCQRALWRSCRQLAQHFKIHLKQLCDGLSGTELMSYFRPGLASASERTNFETNLQLLANAVEEYARRLEDK